MGWEPFPPVAELPYSPVCPRPQGLAFCAPQGPNSGQKLGGRHGAPLNLPACTAPAQETRVLEQAHHTSHPVDWGSSDPDRPAPTGCLRARDSLSALGRPGKGRGWHRALTSKHPHSRSGLAIPSVGTRWSSSHILASRHLPWLVSLHGLLTPPLESLHSGYLLEPLSQSPCLCPCL